MTLIQNHSNQEALNHSQGCFLDTRTFCDAGKLMSEVFLQWAVPLFSPHERCERGGIHVVIQSGLILIFSLYVNVLDSCQNQVFMGILSI